VTYKRLELCQEDSSDSDNWGSLGSMTALLMSIGCLSWWVASMILGPIWLAVRRHEHATLDDSWASGDAL
jgi:hypothetical protein